VERRRRLSMAWRGPKSSGKDPLLARASHYKRNRKHWQRLRLPCAVCGRPIDYDGPNLINGRQNLKALVVGHRVSRYHAKLMGWPESRVNSLQNSQPECRSCSNKSGAQLGRQVQRANAKAKVRLSASDASRW
jgi:5-methylcytosine-specific restriction endonuclease McrA